MDTHAFSLPVIASGKEIMSYLYAKILSQGPFPPAQEVLNEEPIRLAVTQQ